MELPKISGFFETVFARNRPKCEDFPCIFPCMQGIRPRSTPPASLAPSSGNRVRTLKELAPPSAGLHGERALPARGERPAVGQGVGHLADMRVGHHQLDVAGSDGCADGEIEPGAQGGVSVVV